MAFTTAEIKARRQAARAKRSQTAEGTSAPDTKQTGYWLGELSKPTEQTPIGLSEQERSSIYGLGRTQIQGATRASAEAMKEFMGGKGFRAGESGIADTPIAGIMRGGQQQLGDFATSMAAQEAKDRFAQRFQLSQLDQQRLLGGAGIAGGLETANIGAQATLGAARAGAGAARYAAGLGAETAANRLGWEQERFKDYTFPYEKQQGSFGNLMQIYGMQQQSQQDRYAPWYQGLVNTYSQ